MQTSRMMVEVAVRRAIRDVVSGGCSLTSQVNRRVLRNLVENGARYAESPFAKQLFGEVQQMLQSGKHPYYALFSKLVRAVDEKYLLEFAVNLGYESWTVCADKLHQYRNDADTAPDWYGMLALDDTAAENDAAAVRAGLAQNKCCWILTSGKADAPRLRALALAFRSCAFEVFLPDETIDADFLHAMEGTPNLLLLPWRAAGESFTSAPLLRRLRRLYAPCVRYSREADVADLLSGNPIVFPGDPDCLLPVLLPDDSCDKALSARVDEALLRLKYNPNAAQFPISLPYDMLRIQEIILPTHPAKG